MDTDNLVYVAVASAAHFYLGTIRSFALIIDSDDDDDDISIVSSITLKCYKRKPRRIIHYVEHTVPGYTAREFQQHFRLTREAYEALLQLIGPELQRQGDIGRHVIDVEKQILSVIWLLATPDSYRSVGERFDLGKSSLSVCFMRVVKNLSQIAPRIISWPSVGEEMNQVEDRFYQIGRIRGIIGVVDGTYVKIKAPKDDPQSYVTRKCDYAMTLQAICESSLRFTDIFVGYPGSVSDTRIFRNSPLYTRVLNNFEAYFPNNQFILGDKAYPVLNWCIPPYINRGNMTPAKTYFNSRISKVRQVIERSFALLFGRFRRLRYLDMNRTDMVPTTVLASCVLHNICLSHDDLLIEEYIREGAENVLDNDVYENAAAYFQEEGRVRRDQLCRQLFAERV